MWWNFIARSHEEIVQMREAWNSFERADVDGRFGDSGKSEPVFNIFEDRVGGWIPAPELPNVILRPRV